MLFSGVQVEVCRPDFLHVDLSQEDIVFSFTEIPTLLTPGCHCDMRPLSANPSNVSMRGVLLQNLYNSRSDTRLRAPLGDFSVSDPLTDEIQMEYFSDTGYYDNFAVKPFQTGDVVRLGVNFRPNSVLRVVFEAYIFAALAPGQPNGSLRRSSMR